MKQKKLKEDWLVWKEGNTFSLVWDIPENAKKVTIPHDAMIEEQADPDSPNGGNTGFRNSGDFTYRKTIYIPEEAKEKVLKLKFEGVYMNAMVYINQQFAAKNMFGYTTFYVELNDFLKYGEENEIRVQAAAGAMTNSRWYSGAGIYRDVYLLESELAHIVPEGVQIKTEEADGQYAVLEINTELENRDTQGKELILETMIWDESDTLKNTERSKVILFQREQRTITQRMSVKKPRLWSADTPDLYRCVSRLYEKREGKEYLLDEEQEIFGIRTIQVNAQRGLRINGKTVKLRGACIHHDSGILGAATYEDAEYRQMKKIKEAGFNAVRMAHHPMAPAMLRACDRLGIYVMDEAFDMWNRRKSNYDYSLYFEEAWEKDVTAMVRKDYNHPSVILYSAGNEIPDIGMEHGTKTCDSICRKIKKLDETRYTLAAVNGVFAVGDQVERIVKDLSDEIPDHGTVSGNVNDFMTLMNEHMEKIVKHPLIGERLEKVDASVDIVGYNYMTERYEEDVKKYPNRILVGSETCPPEIADIWEQVEKLPSLIGDFTWTGWDYLGEAGVGIPAYAWGEGGFGAKYPAQLAYVGDIDITGFRRPMSYYREIVFGLRSKPYIAVQNPEHYGEKLIKTPWVLSDTNATWNWSGWEGKPVVIEVYAPGEEAELFVNGRTLGKQKSGKSASYRCIYETIYEPGCVEAVVYDAQGKETGREKIKTAAGEKKLLLRKENPWNEETKTNELIYCTLELCDKEGNIYTDCDCEVEIKELAGGELLGFGSADPKTRYHYRDRLSKTFFGRAQIILRKTETAEGKVVAETRTGLRAELEF